MPINSELAPGTKAYKAEYDRARRARLKDEIAEKKRAYVLANFDKEQARVKAWVEANRARSTEIKREWKARNPTPRKPRTLLTDAERSARAVARVAVWRAANPERYALQQAACPAKPRSPTQKAAHSVLQLTRYQRLRTATPAWADKAAIEEVYLKARAQGLQVDHKVPLMGKLVSGLHVANNLQLLTRRENTQKGNRYAG